jgi:hypothetical protein
MRVQSLLFSLKASFPLGTPFTKHFVSFRVALTCCYLNAIYTTENRKSEAICTERSKMQYNGKIAALHTLQNVFVADISPGRCGCYSSAVFLLSASRRHHRLCVEATRCTHALLALQLMLRNKKTIKTPVSPHTVFVTRHLSCVQFHF